MTMTSETSMASVARHRGCEEEDNAVLLLLFLSRVLCTGESDNGSDADLSLGEHMSGASLARQMGWDEGEHRSGAGGESSSES